MEMLIVMILIIKELYFVILEKEYECDEILYDVIIGLFINVVFFSFGLNLVF